MSTWATLPAVPALAGLIIVLSAACKGGGPTSPSGPGDGGLLTFSGVITSAGQPMAGVDIYLSSGASKKTTTASDGKYTFSSLASMNYLITPCRVGFAFSPSNYEVAGPSRSDLNFSGQPATPGAEADRIATNFTARDQNGNAVSLYDSHGKVVLLDFTADWCIDCRTKAETAEEPGLGSAPARLRGPG